MGKKASKKEDKKEDKKPSEPSEAYKKLMKHIKNGKKNDSTEYGQLYVLISEHTKALNTIIREIREGIQHGFKEDMMATQKTLQHELGIGSTHTNNYLSKMIDKNPEIVRAEFPIIGHKNDIYVYVNLNDVEGWTSEILMGWALNYNPTKILDKKSVERILQLEQH